VVKVPLPLTRVPDPSVVAPSKKVAKPVGVPLVEDVTVAVNVTDCPTVDAGALEPTTVVVPALLTVT
jgi:hypothetical protein